MKLKKICAAVAAAATMLVGMVVGASSANAAVPDTGNITISGYVADRTFTAYPLGTYTDVVEDGNSVSSVNFAQNEAWNPSIADAAKAAGITVPAEYRGNTLAYLSTLGSGEQLSAFAAQMAAAATKPAGTVGTNNGTTVTFSGIPAGYYLVTDSDGAPIIVGTTIGNDITQIGSTEVGKAVAKPSQTMPTKTIDETSAAGKNGTVTVGQQVTYRIEAIVPGTVDANDYTMYIKDVASQGQTVPTDASGFTVAVGGTAITGTTVSSTSGTDGSTTTLLTIPGLKGKDGQKVVVTYATTITDAVSNPITNTAYLSSDNQTWSDPSATTLNTYNIALTKVGADGTTPLAGAEFTITGDSITNGYTTPTVTSDSNGAVTFKGLGAGTYSITESKVPDGYLHNVRPSFDVTVATDGSITLEKADGWGLVSYRNKSLTVKNVQSVTQLPLTGAAGITMLVVVALLLAAAAIVLALRSQHVNRRINA